jgi:hypothetical protein
MSSQQEFDKGGKDLDFAFEKFVIWEEERHWTPIVIGAVEGI